MTNDETCIEVRRRFAATPRQVFAAFAEPRRLTRWLSPSAEVTLTVLRFEFRDGGAYRFAYRGPDGETVIVGGTFHTIDPPSHIEFSWVWEPPDKHAGIESRVTVRVTPDGAGAELAIVHERLARPDAAARHAEGWRGALDRLTAMLADGAAKDGC